MEVCNRTRIDEEARKKETRLWNMSRSYDAMDYLLFAICYMVEWLVVSIEDNGLQSLSPPYCHSE